MRWFCKHEYEQAVYIPAKCITEVNRQINVGVTIFKCHKCGKIKILREQDDYYSNSFLEKLKMIKKGTLSIDYYKGADK